VNPETVVYDIGCNAGGFGILLSPHIFSYEGVDSNPRVIEKARSASSGLSNCVFFCGSFGGDVVFNAGNQHTLVLSLAVHAYMEMSMVTYASYLLLALGCPGSYLVLEGHPAGYLGEPEAYWGPLVSALADSGILLVDEFKVRDHRKSKREVRVYRK
jgi:SAM-dependent methyltransferase